MASKKKHPQTSSSPASRPVPPLTPPRRAPLFVLAGLLVLAGAWAYSTSFAGVLVLDDIRAVARNTTIRSWDTALMPPGESTVAGRPVANLSLAVNYALAPADVRDAFVASPGADEAGRDAVLRNLWGYHFLNLAVHLCAALALFGVVRRTFASPRLRAVIDFDHGETNGGWRVANSTWLAFLVALLWVVHPLQTEAVTYVVQRVESLMSLFYLLTVYCAIRSAEGRRPGWWAAASVTACALGMGTKEVMVTAPVMVWVWDRLFLPPAVTTPAARRQPGRSRLALYAGLAATWVILGLLVVNEHRGPSVDVGEGVIWRYLATQAGVIVHYLRLAVVPAPLVFLYTWPLEASFAGVAPQALLVLVLVVVTILGLVRRHPLALAGAWLLLILAPTSSVLPIVTEVAAEHRMYLPLAAVIGCGVLGVFMGGRALLRRASKGTASRFALPATALVVLALVVAAGLATRTRNRDYWSDETLWADTVQKQPANQRARVAYGVTLFAERRLPEAEAQLRAAVDLTPGDPTALGRLGAVLAAEGRLDEAIARLQQAAGVTGGRDAQVLMVLAAAQAEARRFQDAAATAAQGLEVARAQGRGPLADELARRLSAYRALSGRW